MINKLLLYTLGSVVLIGVVNWAANFFYLWWTVWWFDNIAHFLGGMAMAFLSFWIFLKLYTFKTQPSLRNVIFISIFFVLVLGIGWEVFEKVNNISNDFTGETYWQDTSYDIIADIFGAILVGFLIFKKKLYV